MDNADFDLHKSSAFFINNHNELILYNPKIDSEDTSWVKYHHSKFIDN